MRILLSGFEPFLDEKSNPTQLLMHHVNSCHGHERPDWVGLDVRGVVLPVLFEEAFRRLEQERVSFRPDAVICFGLAAGRSSIDLERWAINWVGGVQTVRGDNSGRSFDGPIELAGPSALPSTLPIEALAKALIAKNLPVAISSSAGNYVCNELFYRVQSRLRMTRVRSGFIHIPRIDAQGISWDQLVAGLDTILGVFSNEATKNVLVP